AYDHGWVVYDHNAPHWLGTIATLSDDAVVVDGWTGDYYQAKQPFNFLNGGLANPFQLTVPYNINNASGNIRATDHVQPRDWAESFSPNFKLAYAAQHPSTYEPQGSTALRLLSPSFTRTIRDAGLNEQQGVQALGEGFTRTFRDMVRLGLDPLT